MTDEAFTAIGDAIERINALLPHIGKPRPLDKAETPTMWREITLGNQTFRILTLEDS